MYKLLFSISLILTTCSAAIPYESDPYIDPEIQPYVDRFVNEGQIRNQFVEVDKLVIIFGRTENVAPGAIGVCYLNEDGSRYIVLDRYFWDSVYSLATREILVFHELGHCSLDRGHTDSYAKNGLPISLMNSNLIDTDAYIQNREYYIDELFNGRKK